MDERHGQFLGNGRKTRLYAPSLSSPALSDDSISTKASKYPSLTRTCRELYERRAHCIALTGLDDMHSGRKRFSFLRVSSPCYDSATWTLLLLLLLLHSLPSRFPFPIDLVLLFADPLGFGLRIQKRVQARRDDELVPIAYAHLHICQIRRWWTRRAWRRRLRRAQPWGVRSPGSGWALLRYISAKDRWGGWHACLASAAVGRSVVVGAVEAVRRLHAKRGAVCLVGPVRKDNALFCLLRKECREQVEEGLFQDRG